MRDLIALAGGFQPLAGLRSNGTPQTVIGHDEMLSGTAQDVKRVAWPCPRSGFLRNRNAFRWHDFNDVAVLVEHWIELIGLWEHL